MTEYSNEQYFRSNEFKVLLNRYEQDTCSGEPSYFEPDELTNIAEYYQDHGDTDQALHAVDRAISTFPGTATPLLFRARYALLREDNPQEAERYAQLIDDKTDFDYYYLIAEIMLYRGQDAQADSYLYQHFQEIDSDDRADYIYDVASLLVDYNADQLAEKWIGYTGRKDSQDYREVMARVYALRGEYAQAEQLLEPLVEEHPYSVFYWTQLASAQFMEGQVSEALQSSEFAIAIDPLCDEAIMDKGNCLFTMGKLEQALDYYQRYQKLRPNDPNGETMVGSALVRLGKLEPALAHYQRAMQLASGNSYMQIEIGKQLCLIRSAQGHEDEAMVILDQLGALDGANAAELCVLRGYVCLENNHYERATAWFDEAVSRSDVPIDTERQIGVAAYDNGYTMLAYDIFKRVTTSRPATESVDGWAYYASCCLQLGSYDEFVKALDTACRVNPQEVAMVFAEALPNDINPHHYFEYLKEKFRK